MTSLHQTNRKSTATAKSSGKGAERRQHRRHDLEQQSLKIDRWDGSKRAGNVFGEIVDLSAGGVRIRTEQKNIQADHQIRVRLELPEYAGISPFIDNSSDSDSPQPKREWVGWMAVTRVSDVDEKRAEVSGRLIDMDEMDRGMLSLYLSTQPLAA
jgi:PilZ domain